MSRHIADDSIVVATDSYISETVDGELVVLNVDTGTYYSLAGVGNEIWQELHDPITVEGLYESVSEKYDVDKEECRSDVLSFVTQLREADLLEVENDEKR